MTGVIKSLQQSCPDDVHLANRCECKLLLHLTRAHDGLCPDAFLLQHLLKQVHLEETVAQHSNQLDVQASAEDSALAAFLNAQPSDSASVRVHDAAKIALY